MRRASSVLIAVVAAVAFAGGGSAGPSERAQDQTAIRTWKIHYRAHNGVRRAAYVVLPSWYGPGSSRPTGAD